MSGFSSFRSFRVLVALLIGGTLIGSAMLSLGGTAASAQSVVLPTCADGGVLYPGQVCSNVGFALCASGGASVAGAPCPFNPSGPYASDTVTYPMGVPAACLAGLSATSGCPGAYTPSSYSSTYSSAYGPRPVIAPGGSESLGVGGQYCTLASGGGQVWVPTGASAADMGC